MVLEFAVDEGVTIYDPCEEATFDTVIKDADVAERNVLNL